MPDPPPLVIGVLARAEGRTSRRSPVPSRRGPSRALACLISDRPRRPPSPRAPTGSSRAIEAREHPGREAHDKAILGALEERGWASCAWPATSVLSPGFVGTSRAACSISTRRSCPPSGLHAQRQALEYGVRVAGATVHFVDEGTDTGPIVLQAAVPVRGDDTEASLRPHPGRGAQDLSGGRSPLRRGADPPRRPPRSHQGDGMNRVRRALISVHDKTGVVDFAKGLAALGVEILSTGGRPTSFAAPEWPWWTSPRSRASPRCSTGG